MAGAYIERNCRLHSRAMNNASEKSGENGFACTRNNITSIVFVEGQSVGGNPIPLSLVGAILSKNVSAERGRPFGNQVGSCETD